ncbi:MAG: Gfo/Idh/MocA family oxidoreductase [Chloroflexi bacterium]|nr:MAG: Gfo/Idh/MocA family oxidoreductase [Chloroflexota bacterium]
MGFWGRDWARMVIPEIPEVELVGVVDSDARAIGLLQEQLPISPRRCFSSLEGALDATPADAVLVTTTLPGHAPITRAALDAGLHVLVEKPFTDTLECAQELVDLAAAKGSTLMVSQNYRFFPAVRTAAALVKEASLGELYEVSIDFRRNDPSPPNPSRRHHTHDVQPLLIDMSIHHFDLLRLILGSEPKSITCEAWNRPWSGFQGPCAAVASIRFDSAVVVSYRGSWISAGPETAWAGEWTMEFERGQLSFTSRGEDNVPQDKVVLRPRRGRARTVALPSLAHIDRAGSLAEFASSLRERREPETSGRDNLGTVAFMTAAVKAAERREWVEVEK